MSSVVLFVVVMPSLLAVLLGNVLSSVDLSV